MSRPRDLHGAGLSYVAPIDRQETVTTDRPDDGELLDRLHRLLAAHPTAPVTGIDPDGMFQGLPAHFPMGAHPLIEGAHTALELLVPEDALAAVLNFERTVRDGMSSTICRLVEPPHETIDICAIDATSTYGSYVGIILPAAQDQELPLVQEVLFSPRVARLRKDRFAYVTDIEESVTRMLGWDHDDIVGRRTIEFVHPDDRDRVIEGWMLLLGTVDAPQTQRFRHLRRDGSYVWLEVTNHNRLGSDLSGEVLTDVVDITEEMAAAEALRAREQLLHRLTQALPSGVLQVDADRMIVFTNDRLHQILATPRAPTIGLQLRTVVPEDRPFIEAVLEAVLRNGEDQDVEVRLRVREDELLRLCRLTLRALTDDLGVVTGAIIAVDDVTDSALMQLELHDRATHDALTGCYNRASAMAALDDALLRHTGVGEGTAVVFVDLDHFKPINDRHGHAAGDEVLRAVAERLRSQLRTEDLVGRLGGDEFLMVCPQIADRDEAMGLAQRITSQLEVAVEVLGGMVDVRASIGVTWSNAMGLNSASLVAEADAAMYESKRQGAGRPVRYGPALKASGAQSVSDERRLRDALSAGELVVYYQPIVHLATGGTVGFEALLRWRRDGQVIAAGDFIEVAEQSGSIHEIGAWVLDTVCRDAAAAAAAGHPELWWAVNVSPLQMAATGLTDLVAGTLARHGVVPGSLVLELTEHQTLGQSAEARATLLRLQDLGLNLALDDFGTGWSSLELLRSMAFDGIKIPMPFTSAVVDDLRTAHLIESVISVADRLGSFVVVEGVETTAQRDRLLAAGADLAQGWLFAKALPLEEALPAISRTVA